MPERPITLDTTGFVCVDGVRIGRLIAPGRLQFCDKDRRRAAARGTRYVEVSVEILARWLLSAAPVTNI